ncbi:hypothetical protein QYF61_001690 [Mycteria americana]|uniref:ribonuclease H n=1 Tax=Mycteria americana TaxID=33587 RepID=A0AAN7RVB0_MYCAM|nr:hypothetical protein QYF61_001690 [Mycteria americana]
MARMGPGERGETFAHEKLGGDTAKSVDGNWPKGYSIPSGVMLSIETGGGVGRGIGIAAGGVAGHGSAGGHEFSDFCSLDSFPHPTGAGGGTSAATISPWSPLVAFAVVALESTRLMERLRSGLQVHAPRPLLGRDLLEQLNAEIRFKDGEIEFKIPEESHIEILSLALTEPQVREEEIMQEIKDQVYPGVWASGIPGKAKNAELVVVKLKEGARPIRVKQYPLKLEDRRGVKRIIEEFIKFGLLTECSSEYNTPILPVKKPDGKTYRLVQDLRAINRIVEDLHLVVANPYTLLTSLKETYEWFTVLDLKDAFFWPFTLAPESRNFFAFEWENPDSGRKTQLTWTVLPQGFKNSPTIFGNQLAKELEVWERPPGNGTLLQYVDDILIATEKEEECKEWTVSLLNFLGLSGYRVSLQKVQILKKEVIYLGFVISKGQSSGMTEKKPSAGPQNRPQ